MTAKRTVLALVACAALVAAGCGESEPMSNAPPKAEIAKELAGSPPPLASLHAQHGQLLGGDVKAFNARMASLKGHPVVVNKWASWCGPCRQEFPYFQRLSAKDGKRVAFIGVDSNDVDDAAKRFLGQFPVSYPSYSDAGLKIAQAINAVAAFPTTAFYDSKGKQAFLHQGVYQSEADLQRDIDRYAR